MKKLFILLLVSLLFSLPAAFQAQVGDRTGDVWNVAATPDGGVVNLNWQFSLIADSASVYYSNTFSLPSGYEYDLLLNACATAIIKQTPKHSAAVKGTWTLQGLYGGGTTDTSNVKILRAIAGGVQTANDTSQTFKFRVSAPIYRLKFLPNTGSGQVSLNKLFIQFTKRYDTYIGIQTKK
jgi:hypothetical protein